MADETTASIRHKFEALLDVAMHLGEQLELDSLLNVILDKTTDLMEADRSSLYIYDPEKHELWTKIAQGMNVKEIRLPIGHGIAGTVAESKVLENIPDVYDDKRFDRTFDEKSNYRTKSMLCVPMLDLKSDLIGIIQVMNKHDGEPFTKGDEQVLQAMAGQAAVALQRAQLLENYLENERLVETLKVAETIQLSRLPTQLEAVSDEHLPLDIHAVIKPAKSVGGDLYDYFMLDHDRLLFAVGDVSGKGVPAALFMTVTITMLKATATAEMTPSQILHELNAALCIDNETSMFCTFFCGILNCRTGEITYSNAGHNPPYIMRNNGMAEQLALPHGVALGALPELEFTDAQTTLEVDDTIVLYTDGVNEAINPTMAEFGYERMKNTLETVSGKDSHQVAEKLLHDVESFADTEPQFDDITILAVKRTNE